MMMQKEKRISLPSRKQLFYENEMKRPLLIKTKSFQQKKISETVNQKNIEGKQNFALRKTAYENIEKPVDKMGKMMSKVRTPIKLRLSQQHFIKTKSIFKNITSGQKDQNLATISKDLKQEIVFLLFQNKFLQKGHSNNVFLNLESIGMILDKFINIFDPIQLTQKSSQLTFMNGCLEKLRELKLSQINSEKNKKFTCNKQLSIKFNSEQFYESVRNVKDELKQLNFTRESLLQLNRQIQDKNQKLTITLLQKRRVLQQQIQKITTIRRQLQEYYQQKRKIQRKLQQLRLDQQKIQVEVLRIINYVDNQNRNMHVRNASRDYKEIEGNIYEYAAYLQANQMATSLEFQSIPLKNQIYVIERLENEIKDLNKNLINNEQLSVEDKGRMMRDFVLDLNNQYRRKDEEQERNIKFKTKCIRKFVQMMKLWVDNWTLKQQYLVDLRKQFAYNAFMLDEQFQNLFAQNLCPQCSSNTQNIRQKIIQNFKRMRQNYCLGNSFY